VGKHQFLLGMCCQISVGALATAALVNGDKEGFIVPLTTVDVVSPSGEEVKTSFLGTSTDGFKIDNPFPARFKCIGRWDVA